MRRPHPGGTRPSLVLLPPASYKSATGRERVCPLSCPSRPLIIKKGTYLRPALLCARGRVCPLSGLSRPLINNKKSLPARLPVCPWGRVCPLSCLSRPLINNKKPCLRPACLSVGDASVPRLASLVLLSIRRSPPCGGPILAGRVRPLSCFLRLLIKPLLGGNASVPWLAFSSFYS